MDSDIRLAAMKALLDAEDAKSEAEVKAKKAKVKAFLAMLEAEEASKDAADAEKRQRIILAMATGRDPDEFSPVYKQERKLGEWSYPQPRLPRLEEEPSNWEKGLDLFRALIGVRDNRTRW